MLVKAASELRIDLAEKIYEVKTGIAAKLNTALSKLKYQVEGNYSIKIYDVDQVHKPLVEKMMAEAGYNVTRCIRAGNPQFDRDIHIEFTLPPKSE